MGFKNKFYNLKGISFKSMKLPKVSFNLKWILLILLAITLTGGVLFFLNYDPLTPEETVNKAIKATLEAESYRYTAISKRINNGEEQLLSEVTGEKSKENVHFFGKLHVVNSNFEYYQVENQIYRKDAFSSDWLVVDQVNLEVTEKLIQEINPLGAFALKGPIEVEYLDKEKIDGRTYKKYQVVANTDNKYLEVLWQDFSYIIWVDHKEKVMKKAEIKAQNKRSEDHILMMSVEFTDYNQEIIIKPPI